MKYLISSLLLVLLIVGCNNSKKSTQNTQECQPCNKLQGDITHTNNIDTAFKYKRCVNDLDLMIPNRSYQLRSLSFLKNDMFISITNEVGADWKPIFQRIAEIDSIYLLDINGTPQKTLPIFLNKKNTLRELKIGLQLDTFPTIIGEMKNLEQLEVWDTEHLKTFPSAILKLVKLRSLLIQNGSFDSLPNRICELKNLEILRIPGAKNLKKLPSDIVKIKGLKEINIIRTKLAYNELLYFKKHKHYNQLQFIVDALPNCRIKLWPHVPPPRPSSGDIRLLP